MTDPTTFVAIGFAAGVAFHGAARLAIYDVDDEDEDSREVATDGGLVAACPQHDCDSTALKNVVGTGNCCDPVDHDYRCEECGHRMDEDEVHWREPHRDGEFRHGRARKLVEADPDMVIDGGRSDESEQPNNLRVETRTSRRHIDLVRQDCPSCGETVDSALNNRTGEWDTKLEKCIYCGHDLVWSLGTETDHDFVTDGGTSQTYVVLVDGPDDPTIEGVYDDVEEATETAKAADGPISVQSVPDHRTGAGRGNVTVPREAARVAARELDYLIDRSGGADCPPTEARSPLAEARDRIEDLEHVAQHAQRETLQILYTVAEDRGVEIRDVDPLTGGVFRARDHFAEAVGETVAATDGGRARVDDLTDERDD